jgi:hypothetical protein
MTIEKKSGKVERVLVHESQKPEFRGQAKAYDGAKGLAPENFTLPEPTNVPPKPTKEKE